MTNPSTVFTLTKQKKKKLNLSIENTKKRTIFVPVDDEFHRAYRLDHDEYMYNLLVVHIHDLDLRQSMYHFGKRSPNGNFVDILCYPNLDMDFGMFADISLRI